LDALVGMASGPHMGPPLALAVLGRSAATSEEAMVGRPDGLPVVAASVARMSALDALIPPWVKFGAIALLAIGLVGGFFALKASWQAEGAAKVIAADQQAVLEQKAKDEKLSNQLVADQAAEIAALQDKAQTVVTRIVNAPSTSGCGPVMRDASHGVRELFDGAGGKDAGRQPVAAVPGSAARR
jgi:hypothetical protein